VYGRCSIIVNTAVTAQFELNAQVKGEELKGGKLAVMENKTQAAL
jgi:hypothetical protein